VVDLINFFCIKSIRLHLDFIYCYKIVSEHIKLNFIFLTFLVFLTAQCPLEGMPTNFTNQEVVMSELFFACGVVNTAAFKRSILLILVSL